MGFSELICGLGVLVREELEIMFLSVFATTQLFA